MSTHFDMNLFILNTKLQKKKNKTKKTKVSCLQVVSNALSPLNEMDEWWCDLFNKKIGAYSKVESLEHFHWECQMGYVGLIYHQTLKMMLQPVF